MKEIINRAKEEKVVETWKRMGEEEKGHFINQVAIALSVWGEDKGGKKLVVEVLKEMTNNGSQTLADFGLYVDKILDKKIAKGKKDQIKRAATIIEGYRIKHSLSSVPHKDLV